MTSEILQGLNDRQHAAVTAGDGPVLVLAGPGSGKTSVLTRRIAYLIEERGIKPWNIMAVTFTNKAASEMKDRVHRLLGEPVRIQLGTFHATCARILRIEHGYTDYNQDFVIYDTDDQLSAIEQAMAELNIDKKRFSARAVLRAISSAKNEMILASDYLEQDYFTTIVSRVYPRYQAILLDSNAMDFDDLLVNVVKAFKQHDDLRQKYQQRYPYVLVDEFQDTNMVQYQLMHLLGAPQNNIFAVGDEDQSIYAFRGADYRNVGNFRQNFPGAEVILLEQNYRSTQVILDVARAVIDRNTNRTPKELFTDRDGGELVTIHEAYDDDYEARFIVEKIEELRSNNGYDFNDIAIMYRTNAQSRAIEDACIRSGLPYTLVGGVGFYKRREIRDMIAYLRVVYNPDDKMSFARIINTPRRGIGKKTFAEFTQWAAQNNMGYAEALQRLQEGSVSALSGRAETHFRKFAKMLDSWQELAMTGKLLNLFDTIMHDVQYKTHARKISDSDAQFNEREENLQELRGLLAEADENEQELGEFVTDIMLMTDADTADIDSDKVTLMTLHAAKGLEFPVVFITGLENKLLPHQRALDDSGTEGLEEERRLFYVGITRAEDRLYLTYAFKRTMYGVSDAREPSSFLGDIPVDYLQGEPVSDGDEPYQQMTTWDSDYSDDMDRIKNDLQNAMNRMKSRNKERGHVSDEQIRGKIIPFPGSDAGKPLQFDSNMRVRHPAFGTGIVIESKRVDGSEQVTVAFKDKRYGVKTLDAEFASMTILD